MNEKPILIEDSVEYFNPTYDRKKFIVQLLARLRESFTLLDDHDYKRLYDEILDFLFRDAVTFLEFDENTRVSSYVLFELCADGYNTRNIEKISIDILSDFLNERRRVWENMSNSRYNDEYLQQ